MTTTAASAMTGRPTNSVDPAVNDAHSGTYTQAGITTMKGMVSTYRLQQLGGLACEWSNAQYTTPDQGASNYSGLTVDLLFEGAQRDGVMYTYPSPDGDNPTCSSGSCGREEVFGDGMWLQMSLQLPYDLDNHPMTTDTAPLTAAFDAAFDGIKAKMQAAAPTGATWHPAGTLTIAGDCPTILSPEQVKAALGLPYDLMISHGDGYAFPTTVALATLGDSCAWTSATDDHDGIVGTMAVQRDGAWAWARAQSLPSALGVPQKLTVAGLKKGDEAWVRCDPQHLSCLADVVVGGDWFEFSLFDGGQSNVGYDKPTIDRLTAITALAAEVVAKVRG